MPGFRFVGNGKSPPPPLSRSRSQAPAWERLCLRGSSLPFLSGALCFWRSGRRLEPPGILHSQAGAWERACVSKGPRLNLIAVGQRTRLHCSRAVGAESLFATGRFIGSLRRACPESVEGISRGDPDVLFSRREIGTDGSSCGAVSFEDGEWWHNAGWRAVRSFASSG